nr:hypothetical protein [Tanacetum cinerariifolium]
DCRRRVQRETNGSQNHSYKRSTHRSAGHRRNGAHMRPPLRSSGPRPHGNYMRTPFRPASHRPHGPSMNEEIFPLPIGNFPLLAENLPPVAQKNHTADMGRKGKAVNPSACWTWKPSQELSHKDGNTVCVTTATTPFPTGSVNISIISQDTASAFIASQSNGSQIKFEDINQIDEDDMEEMDIK